MKKLTHKFVDHIPAILEADTIYVSIQFGVVTHACCCGCGNEVVVRLSPTGWQLTYDGQAVSLSPSIGNWGLKCRSHYWIVRNTVKWAENWSDERVRRAQEADALSRNCVLAPSEPKVPSYANDAGPVKVDNGRKSKFWKWWSAS